MRTRFWIGSLLIALALAPGVSMADEALVRRLHVVPGSPGSADLTLSLEIARGHMAERGRSESSAGRRYRLRVSDGRSVTRWISDWRPIPSEEDVRLQCTLPLQEACPRDSIVDSAFNELWIEVMVEQPGRAPSASTFTLYRWVAGGYQLFPEPRP